MTLPGFFAEVHVISQRMSLKDADDVYSALREASIRHRVEPNEQLKEWAKQIAAGTEVRPRLG